MSIVGLAYICVADNLSLYGRVKENVGKTDLIRAKVLVYDSLGNVKDTIPANQGFRWRGRGEVDTLSNFRIEVPRVDSTYYFDVICDGYSPKTISYTVEKVGKRERYRDIPVVFLERAPRMLKEVTVTTSKIKFYNKGDTLVYNADAFQLAEGSMLDALIAQLPGVELSPDGQIKVNGKFVESLLLNGKEFMDGDNNLMLENIAAYTVKDVSVYEGQTKEAKRTGDLTADKILTMDVKLKKDYNIGWVINAQGGYGTENRYIGRLFALWFNPTTRVGLAANTNNLNDNRVPGRSDTWTPEQMPSGRSEYIHAALDYNYESADEYTEAQGNVKLYQSKNNNDRTALQTSFLPGSQIYDRTFRHAYHRNTNISTYHSFWKRTSQKFSTGTNLYGEFKYWKDATNSVAGTFDEDPGNVSAEILDALHNATGNHLMDILVNRSKTRSDGWRRELKGDIRHYGSLTLKGGDRLGYNLFAGYSAMKEEVWDDYDILYRDNPSAAQNIRHYTDRNPNNHFWANGELSYNLSINNLFLRLSAAYGIEEWHKDQYLYALEHLNDMGIYGIVPVGYLQSLDPANSYSSRQINNEYLFIPSIYYSTSYRDGRNFFMFNIRPQVTFLHRHLFYDRAGQHYSIGKSDFSVDFYSRWNFMLNFGFGLDKESHKTRHSLEYCLSLQTKRPEMTDLLDIVNDADPLNVYVGNPDLKPERYYVNELNWYYNAIHKPIDNRMRFAYSFTTDALVQGYTFDTQTGVRYFKRYNLSGNDFYEWSDNFSFQFGRKKQFTLSAESSASLWHYTDMMGIDRTEPELTKVRYTTLGEKLTFSWEVGGQTLKAFGNYNNRRTKSTQDGGAPLNAHHTSFGVSGVFKLPAGFGASTDFTCYTRRGYGIEALDKTDPVWNLRLTYCPPRYNKWVFMVDGFDMLHKLSNVNYSVTATGRTVTYTNALPRYVLFSVQYRLNLQPKKR